MTVVDLATEAPPEVETDPQEPQEEQETPSVFSVATRYLVGRAEVAPPAEDGSRVVRLYSGNASTIIEANLAPQLCEFLATKLVEVAIIEEGVEDASDTAD
jgi:hypothetical protein